VVHTETHAMTHLYARGTPKQVNFYTTRRDATGGAVNDGHERTILAAHVRGLDGMCAGCRAWWSRLAPYPCWQVEWATSRHARTITARFLEGVR
ncbi:hypothetical protein, partial [Micromonospora sp. NPDC004551]|uniref:hypothetical protein n=1 Tax=Micromonospora sp. NPDC004551 TaxID=3154284 RepID=UPI0033AC28DC